MCIIKIQSQNLILHDRLLADDLTEASAVQPADIQTQFWCDLRLCQRKIICYARGCVIPMTVPYSRWLMLRKSRNLLLLESFKLRRFTIYYFISFGKEPIYLYLFFKVLLSFKRTLNRTFDVECKTYINWWIKQSKETSLPRVSFFHRISKFPKWF